MGEDYGEIVSASPTYFEVCFCCRCMTSQLVSEFLSEGIVPHVVVDSAYLWEGVSLGTSSVTILNFNLPNYSNKD